MIENKRKIMSKIKSKKKLANCRLKTCLAGRQAAHLPILLMTIILLLTHTTELHSTIRYVSHTGSSTPPYTSWETAADSIQKAIDICLPGDTVLVANGVYYEALYIDKTIHLIGSSMDSTIIDASFNTVSNVLRFMENNSTIKQFKITSNNAERIGINARWSNLIAEFCRINGVRIPVSTNASVKISSFIIEVIHLAFRDECPSNDCYSIYSDNILICNISGSFDPPVLFLYGGRPTFTNNLLIGLTNSSRRGIYSFTSGTVIKNNLIAGFLTYGLDISRLNVPGNDTVYNNVLSDLPNTGVVNGTNLILGNNIFNKVGTGIHTYGPQTRSDYNLYWRVNQLITGQPFIGDSNVFADPMFVKDTLPNPQLDFDYHLQAYSPAIDKGDPSILDVDGSRSDIGMFGGPLGQKYTYLDLAPKPPRNLTATLDSGLVLLKWNKNTETDLYRYRVYRDTVPDFIYDTTKIVAVVADTFYYDIIPDKYSPKDFYYKLTAIDSAYNQSAASEEVHVNITGIPEAPPVVVEHYRLLQNYPNPFNPSTTIPYRLKEPGYVKVMVYNLLGELVKVLVNQWQDKGYYEILFQPDNIQRKKAEGFVEFETGYYGNIVSGIYLYRIEIIGEGSIPRFSDMKKMLLVK